MSLVPQEILDALTRVDMPKVAGADAAQDSVEINGLKISVRKTGCMVLGSGAAGLRAACEAKRLGVDVLIASMSIFGGTSACSGSDKQTLHTAGTGRNGDNFKTLAHDIGSGGCMDHDTAYIESVGSIGAFAGLQYLGLPLPQDRFGAVLRYQTDHDEVGRATSCGPRTSRLMVKVLAEEAVRLQIPFLRKAEGIKILKTGEGDNEKISEKVSGVLLIDREDNSNEFGLSIVLCESLVLATGGPGELYRDSVYPKHCYGSLGMAIEAGLETCNLTESQFGIGTRRTEFPWNLSGTYVQVMPYIYSVDEEGNEYNFLADYFRTTQELVSNVFRKGYQWPFHATRMLNYQSSLVDLAIFLESRKGRTILMDFLRNPEAVPGDKPFSLDELDEDVANYIKNNEATHELPIDRLRRMNPLAIELYKMHGTDIGKEPLPFNVSNQHMNGGVAVDSWSHSSLAQCYAVGEVSGTHGVTRPGGAALNAGQVAGMRCAQHMASRQRREGAGSSFVDVSAVETQVSEVIELAKASLSNDGGLEIAAVRDEIQARMSDKAGFICMVDEVAPAHADAEKLRKEIYGEKGLSVSSNAKLADVFRWRHLSLASEAVLAALDHYTAQGGGSRGARAMCTADGQSVPEMRNGDLEGYRFRDERDCDKENKIIAVFKDGEIKIEERALRKIDNLDGIFFEKNWHHYLTDNIYSNGFSHDS